MYLWIGNALMLIGAIGIPALASHGYISKYSLAVFLSSVMLLIFIYLMFARMITKKESEAEPNKG